MGICMEFPLRYVATGLEGCRFIVAGLASAAMASISRADHAYKARIMLHEGNNPEARNNSLATASMQTLSRYASGEQNSCNLEGGYVSGCEGRRCTRQLSKTPSGSWKSIVPLSTVGLCRSQS